MHNSIFSDDLNENQYIDNSLVQQFNPIQNVYMIENNDFSMEFFKLDHEFKDFDNNEMQCFDSSNQQYKNSNQESKVTLYKFITPKSVTKILTGLSITDDGIIRLNSALDQVSFGFYQQQVSSIEYKKNIGVIDLKFLFDHITPQISLGDALNMIQQLPQPIYFEMVEKIHVHYELMNKMKTAINNEDISNYQINDKNEEFQQHIQSCYEYLNNNYNKSNSEQMYWYAIGRLNFIQQDVEISHSGYSKHYLEFLGIDVDSFSQIILRNQKIDLIKDQRDILNQTLTGLAQRLPQNDNEQVFTSTIITFDGFPLKLIQRKKNIPQFFKSNSQIYNKREYIFCVTEMDIQLNDLHQLILYRQRIYQNKNFLNQEDFFKKELSFMFEDVEYSIKSHNFLEKYYLENLQKIYNQQQKILYLNETRKESGYKNIITIKNN